MARKAAKRQVPQDDVESGADEDLSEEDAEVEEDGEQEDEALDGEEEEDGEEEDDEERSEEEPDSEGASSDEDGDEAKNKEKSEFVADLGHMAAFNSAPVDASKLKKSTEAYLREVAAADAQLMFRDLMALPGVDGSPSLKLLPKPQFRVPRHKPAPKPKAETRWEKFAREKGLDNRKKRDRMLWDEASQTWKPRWGYGRGNTDQNDWLIELDEKEEGTSDKFQERREGKKMRVLKNRAKYLRNKAEADSGVSPAAQVENLNVDGARAGASRRGKSKVVNSLQTAQVSTASLGRFDPVMDGEGKRQLGSRKRKFLPSQSTGDLDRDKKILGRLLGKHIGGATSSAGAEEPRSGKKGKKQRRGKR